MRIFFVLTAAFAVSTSANAAVMTFDNLTDFTNALPSGAVTTTDGFDNDIAQAQSITFDSGVTSTNSGMILFDDNSVVGGQFNNALDLGGTAGSEMITFVFPEPVIGLGFDVLNVNNSGVQLTLDDGGGPETFELFDVAGAAFGFVGFVGDNAFTSVVFSTAFATDVFSLDNLVFATAGPDPSVVPLPAAAWLFLAGLGGLAAARRRRGRS